MDQNEVNDDGWQRQRQQPLRPQTEQEGVGTARGNDNNNVDGAQDDKDVAEPLIIFYGANSNRGEDDVTYGKQGDIITAPHTLCQYDDDKCGGTTRMETLLEDVSKQRGEQRNGNRGEEKAELRHGR